MSLGHWLEKWNLFATDQVALVDGDSGERWTYGDFYRRSMTRAQWLRDVHKIGPGDRVAWTEKNRLEFFEVFFACARLGAILVPVNWRLAKPEVDWILENAGAKLIIDDSSLTELTLTGEVPQIPAARVNDSSPVMILYTSGTTGRPKGALLTHGSITANSLNTTIACDLRSTDSTITYTPLFHTGAVNVLSLPLFHRGAKVILTRQFDGPQILKIIEEESITILFGVPTTFEMIRDSERFSQTDFSSVRFSLCGGAPCPVDLIHDYAKQNVVFRQGYGLTEVGPNCFSLPPEDAVRKAGTVGFPVMHCEARIVDGDGQECPAGEVGELWLRGPHVCGGYWNNPEATAAALNDGWWATGDLFQIDGDGYFKVVGRKKEMFISGGENIYPAEVEAAILRLPDVKEVTVFGVRDPRWGEVGMAVVTPEHIQTEELKTLLNSEIARYKIPKHWLAIDALPRTASGKVDRRKVTEIGTKSPVIRNALSKVLAVFLLLLSPLFLSTANAAPGTLLTEPKVLGDAKSGHKAAVTAVAIHENQALSADRKGQAWLWDLKKSKVIAGFPKVESALLTVQLRKDWALIGDESGLVRYFNVKDLKQEKDNDYPVAKLKRSFKFTQSKKKGAFKETVGATATAIHDTDKTILIGYGNGTITEFSLESGKQLTTWVKTQRDRIVQIEYLPKSLSKQGRFVSVSWDGSVAFYKKKGKATSLGLVELTGLLIQSDKKRILVTNHVGQLYQWNVQKALKKGLKTVSTTENPEGWLSHPAIIGKTVIGLSPNDNAVVLFDAKGQMIGKHQIASLDVKELRVGMCLAASKEAVLTGNSDGSLSLFELGGKK
ncbi:MAG: long-chain fatty acid--CoA ligase [Planctomycetota bacterium]|nr:long-chain fatty acid--CoA ligase [Planctomycetota bacterium]